MVPEPPHPTLAAEIQLQLNKSGQFSTNFGNLKNNNGYVKPLVDLIHLRT